MDDYRKRKYRREAALWAAEGKRAMSVDPQHLLELIADFRPPTPPTELERRIVRLQGELAHAQAQLRQESDRANRAHAQGYAAGVLEQDKTVRELRAQIAKKTAKDQSRA